jgi:dihydroxy-acid dehydratase
MHRASVEQLSEGMVLKAAVKYQRIAQKTTPRDSH